MADTHKTKRVLNITIDVINKDYLNSIRDNKSINISRYVNELITLDRIQNEKK